MKEITSDILTQQQEHLIEIGSQLQADRLERGWALSFVARQTKIRATLLRHLEAGELKQLPEPVYVRGLIHRYAECLGLDAQAIASQFLIEDKPHGWQLPFWKRSSLPP